MAHPDADMSDFATAQVESALDAKGFRDDDEIRSFCAEIINQIERADFSASSSGAFQRGLAATCIVDAMRMLARR